MRSLDGGTQAAWQRASGLLSGDHRRLKVGVRGTGGTPDFLAFLKQVAAAYPRRELHVVVDNYATHKHPAVRAWLARHPRVHLHFTPTSSSWLNLVEALFSIITRQALRRGNFPSVVDLIAAIHRFIAA